MSFRGLRGQYFKEAHMQGEGNYGSTQSSGQGASAVGNPGGSIQDAMDASRSKLAAAYAAMQERSNQALSGAQGYIQERPLQSVIYAASIGAVIGFVAGMLLGGERSDNSWYRRWW
jgi:ElaB/YqjD/DUF883 family membrane-anchored ribosome-binding protein